MTSLLDTRRVFVFILALGLFAMAARNVTDPDVWWHLRTGELTVKNHAVFHTDPFSFTRTGQSWVNHEWLSDVLMFSIYRVSGWLGLVSFFALITSTTFMVVFARCAARPYLAGAFTVWGAVASFPAWGVRPQNLSLLLLSVFLWLLGRSDIRQNLVWLTVPLMLLWVNLHAGYIAGIALMILYWIGDLIERSFGLPDLPKRAPAKLAIATVACLAVVPLNPYGLRMYLYPLQTIHSRFMPSYISEWISPNFHQQMYLPLLLLILSIIGAIAVSPVRLRPRELLLLGVTLWAALHSARHVPIFALVAAPILSGLVQGWRTRSVAPATTISATTISAATKLMRLVNSAILAFFVAISVFKARHVALTQSFSEDHSFPRAAVSFLAAERLPQPLFNNYNWGGYLVWRVFPEYRVFIDGRADVYGDSFLEEYAGIYQLSSASWQNDLERWNVQTVILPPDAPLIAALRLNSDWKQAYADSLAVIMVKYPGH